MKTWQVIFSPTGGTEKVADAIVHTWPKSEKIDMSVYDTDYANISFDSDSIVLIAMPSFGGVAPQLALDRLSMMKGNGALCVIAAVYGNRAYDDTLIQMKDFAQNAGFRVIAAISAVAEHSIIHKYGTERPNEDDCRTLQKFGKQIFEKVSSKNFSEPFVPGNRPYKTAGKGMIPKADSSCISCGKCALKCPANAIHPNDFKISKKNQCISCMRCVSICPVHARKVNKLMTSMAALAIKKSCSIEKKDELFI